MPIRTLFTTPSLAAGGAEQHLIRLLRRFDRQRFAVALAVARGGGALTGELPSDLVPRVLCAGRPWSAFVRALRAVRPLRRLFEAERPDVVCAVQDLAGVTALLAARRTSQRPVCVVAVQNVASRLRRSGKLTDRWLLALMRRLYPEADRLIAPCRGVAADLVATAGVAPERIEVLANAGVDDAVLAAPPSPPPDLARPETGALVVACGRLVAQKGFLDLLAAFRGLCETHAAELWILGEGEQRPELVRAIRRLGLDGRVRLLGFRRDPLAVMGLADLFVLSSHWEGFGNVVVEAMACGTPVVATDCPHGPGEVVVHGESGLLTRPGDVDALAAAMRQVLGDRALAARLAAAGRERARRFTASAAAAGYAELFVRLAPPEEGRT